METEKVMTAENVDVARLMAIEETADLSAKVEEFLKADPVATKLMKAAETVEDVYEVVKKCMKITFDEFKIIFHKTVNYFKEEKAELPDEVMDNVVGGSWFGDVWNKYKNEIVICAITVGCCVVGAAVGAVLGGGPGALALGLIGFGVGVCAAGIYKAYAEGYMDD